mgnify:CR=1 FL=1
MLQPSEIPNLTLSQLRGLFKSRKKDKPMSYGQVLKQVRHLQGRI